MTWPKILTPGNPDWKGLSICSIARDSHLTALQFQIPWTKNITFFTSKLNNHADWNNLKQNLVPQFSTFFCTSTYIQNIVRFWQSNIPSLLAFDISIVVKNNCRYPKITTSTAVSGRKSSPDKILSACPKTPTLLKTMRWLVHLAFAYHPNSKTKMQNLFSKMNCNYQTQFTGLTCLHLSDQLQILLLFPWSHLKHAHPSIRSPLLLPRPQYLHHSSPLLHHLPPHPRYLHQCPTSTHT